MTDTQYDAIIALLAEIKGLLSDKQQSAPASAASVAGTFEVSIEEDGRATRNGNWTLFRGKFQRQDRKYPDWVSLFVRTEHADELGAGMKATVDGRLREEKGENGKPLFSIFANSVAVVAESADADVPADEEIPF